MGWDGAEYQWTGPGPALSSHFYKEENWLWEMAGTILCDTSGIWIQGCTFGKGQDNGPSFQ